MLVPDMEFSLAKAASRFKEVRQYNEFTQNPIQELRIALDELGVSGERMAVEDAFYPGISQ